MIGQSDPTHPIIAIKPVEEDQSCVCFVVYMFHFCISDNLHYTRDKFSGGINTFWSKCKCQGATCSELVFGDPAPGLS